MATTVRVDDQMSTVYVHEDLAILIARTAPPDDRGGRRSDVERALAHARARAWLRWPWAAQPPSRTGRRPLTAAQVRQYSKQTAERAAARAKRPRGRGLRTQPGVGLVESLRRREAAVINSALETVELVERRPAHARRQHARVAARQEIRSRVAAVRELRDGRPRFDEGAVLGAEDELRADADGQLAWQRIHIAGRDLDPKRRAELLAARPDRCALEALAEITGILEHRDAPPPSVVLDLPRDRYLAYRINARAIRVLSWSEPTRIFSPART